jgi:hypothetical protein
MLTERNDGLPILNPDRARGAEPRHPNTRQLVEENAAVGVGPALWHELEATVSVASGAVSSYHTWPH